ncbi:MAG: hypothetical protein IJV80_01135 [Clostridia bacterium]|nr:hypothetical protein [Clostridia bacterium]
MIDFHTHILPGIDDGATSVEQAVKMLETLQAQGVQTVVSTSHYYGKQRSPQAFLSLRNEAAERLAGKIPSGINVLLGAEVHFTEESQLSHEAICSLAIEGTRLVLVELPFYRKWTKKLLDRLAEFVSETDYVPIIAHIERYPSVLRKPSLVNELLDMGCLIQVNTEAFLDKRTKSFAATLLEKGFVYCIGTDSHNDSSRAPNYEKAVLTLKDMGLEQDFLSVQEGMKTLLSGGQVPIYTRPVLKKTFHGYR